MTDLINMFPTILLGIAIVLTLVLLPLLNDDAGSRRDDRQRTDEIRLQIRDKRREP